MKLAQRAIRGMAWAYTVFFGGRLFTFLVTAILARILLVEDFGLLGYALLLLTFIEATQDFGINDAMIYNTEREEDTANTAFWMNLGIGVLQYTLVWFLAPLALTLPAESGNPPDPVIVPILRVIGLVFIINALGNTHDGLLQKNLEFRKRYLPEFFSAVIKGIASIALALIIRNVWALVIGHVIGAVVRAVSKWWLMPFRPKLAFYPERARALWSFGSYILVFGIFSIALDQADQAAIAILIGVTQLGFYTIAVKIPEMVIANFSLVLTRVLFPVFAKMKDNIPRLTDSFLATTQYTAFFTVPAGLGMAAVAPELIVVVFGEKWIPAIGLLQALALLGMGATLPWTAGDMFKAAGRPDISTKLLFVEALYSFPMIIAAAVITREAFWASTANMLAVMITAVVRLWFASRFLKFSPVRYWRVFRTPFIAGGVMVLAVQGVRYFTSDLPVVLTSSHESIVDTLALAPPIPYAVTLLVSILVGAAVYVPLLWFMERENLMGARDMLQSALRKDDDAEEIAESAVDVLDDAGDASLKPSV